MSTGKVYVSLSQFCENDDRPRQVLFDAGLEVAENRTGQRLQRQELVEALGDADAVLAGVEPYDADLLAGLPSLRCISRCGAGTDSIDLEAAGRLNIAVFATRKEVVEPVAQLTMGMILALARNFPLHIDDFRSGHWQKHTGSLLSEWTIGLVGFGQIGRRVEQYLRMFKPRVLVTDPNVDAAEIPDGVQLCDLNELLPEADLVSLHASHASQDGPLLGCREIRGMRPGSRLVNTARGHLVDESELLEGLKSGHLAGAALDVFGVEPYSGPLARLPQVLCTSHVATLTGASRAAMELRCAKNAVQFLSQKGANA